MDFSVSEPMAENNRIIQSNNFLVTLLEYIGIIFIDNDDRLKQ